MRTITCFAARLRPGLQPPLPPVDLLGRDISTFFGAASLKPNGQHALDLRFDVSRLDNEHVPAHIEIDFFHLQDALTRLVNNQQSQNGVNRIGMLFADRLRSHPGLFGLMFDVGFDAVDLPGLLPQHFAIAREGCAVFLDAIDSQRQPAHRAIEASFTAFHELGHVFNLEHASTPSFMAQSPSGAPFTSNEHFLMPDQADFLSRVEIDRAVFPGGAEWRDRGDLVRVSNNLLATAKRSGPIKLRIGMAQKEFWRFEPVELDVTVSAPPALAATLPDELDPGYDAFDLWIEEPDGSRRRYRSPHVFCQNHGNLSFGARKTFVRDISVFGEGGRYTFRTAGPHRLYATWQVRGHGVVKSNVLDVEIKTAQPNSPQFQRLRDVLTHRRHARYLFHKHGRLSPGSYDELVTLSRQAWRSPAAAQVAFTLGRDLWRREWGAARRRTRIGRAKGRDLVARAAESGLLGAARRRGATGLLKGDQEP